MARATKPPVDPDAAPLRRLGGGRWETRDERFTIEPQSGTWVVVDAEQTDDLGLPLVRGPYPSLTSAKEAISGARSSEPATSPLVGRIERRRRAESARPAESAPRRSTKRAPDEPPDGLDGEVKGASDAQRVLPVSRTKPARPNPTTVGAKPRASGARSISLPAATPDEPREPGWITDLGGPQRGRARRLIATLVDQGVSDAEGIVRRDLVGHVPALAGHALARRLGALGDDASTDQLIELLVEGRDETLGVRWHLVDGEGRPITVDRPRPRRG